MGSPQEQPLLSFPNSPPPPPPLDGHGSGPGSPFDLLPSHDAAVTSGLTGPVCSGAASASGLAQAQAQAQACFLSPLHVLRTSAARTTPAPVTLTAKGGWPSRSPPASPEIQSGRRKEARGGRAVALRQEPVGAQPAAHQEDPKGGSRAPRLGPGTRPSHAVACWSDACPAPPRQPGHLGLTSQPCSSPHGWPAQPLSRRRKDPKATSREPPSHSAEQPPSPLCGGQSVCVRVASRLALRSSSVSLLLSPGLCKAEPILQDA